MTTSRAPRELKFGDVAMQKGLVTEAQLLECLTIQKQLVEMGVHEALGEILQKKGYLRADQVAQVLKAMGIDVSPVPGYQILARLGQGGMGTVYKAKQVSMARVVALKVLSAEMTKNKEFVERFLREARAAAQMNHKNVVQAFDAGVQNGVYYFAMEYVEGQTVGEMLKKQGRFSEKRSLEVTLGIAEALDYLHHHGMVHRDIKPENIMISAAGGVKLLDFGLLKQVTTDLSVTRSGFTFGTPYFMSPEQIQGSRRLDSRSDIYSLGTCFYKMLTGRHVFEGETLQAVLTKHLTENVVPPNRHVPDLCEPTVQIAMKMLEKDRNNRYRSPRELVHDLRSILAGGDPAFARQRRASTSRGGWMAAAALILAAIGVGTYLYLNQAPRRPAAIPTVQRPPRPEPVPAPAPPPAVPVPPKPARTPELEAERLWIQADTFWEAKSWVKALEGYDRLIQDRELSETRFVGGKRVEIARRAEICRARLDEAQRGTAADRDRAMRERFAEMERQLAQKQWPEARGKLEALAAEALPDDLLGQVRDRLMQCQREMDAARQLEEIQAAYSAGQYELIESLAKTFRANFAGSATLKDSAADLDRLAADAAVEARAKGAIAAAIKLQQAGETEAFLRALEGLRSEYRSTQSYRAVERQFDQLALEAKRAMAAPQEQEASALLQRADELFKDPEMWSVALEVYRRAMAEAGATEAVQKRRPELEPRIRKLETDVKEARERRAAEALKEARNLFDKKKFGESLAKLKELAMDHSETDTYAREKRNIEALRAKVEKEAEKEARAFQLDLRRVEGWDTRGPGDRSIEESDLDGRKCARIRFSMRQDGWGIVERRVEEGFGKDLKFISFRACSGEANPISVLFFVKMVEEGEEYFFVAERPVIPRAWNPYKVGSQDFRAIQVREGQTRSPKLDFAKVRSIGFCHGPGHLFSPYILFVDQIRAEYK
jgi:serine/threonine-protein kinase